MLRSVKDLRDYRLRSTDETFGHVNDIYLDDREWRVRYLEIDTGTWLPGRKVLIPPSEIREPNWATKELPVSLTRNQIEQSPVIASNEPIARVREMELYSYYGWQPYWAGNIMNESDRTAINQALRPGKSAVAQSDYLGSDSEFVMDGPRADLSDVPGRHQDLAEPSHSRDDIRGDVKPLDESAIIHNDVHLRSARRMTGYHIQAADGEIGHVEDCIVDDIDWVIRYLVIDTRNWLPGRKVLIASWWVDGVSDDDRQVLVDLTRDIIKNSPEYDPSTPVNRQYEEVYFDYYGRPRYWQ